VGTAIQIVRFPHREVADGVHRWLGPEIYKVRSRVLAGYGER
jgi:hypothetical protein